MFGVGFSEMIVIAIVGILLFGGDLPQIARQLGKFVRKIQKNLNDIKNDIDQAS